jgi:glutamate-1-semialdehyde 2,1-aminomutase
MAAGIATLRQLGKAQYARLEELGRQLEAGLSEAARSAGARVQINRVGSMITVFFSADPVFDAASARKADTKKFSRYFQVMLENGVYLPPSQFEAAFLSTSHTDEDVAATVAAATKAFAEAAKA